MAHITPACARESLRLRDAFLVALGASGKAQGTAAAELNITRSTISHWCGGRNLNEVYHPRVREWIAQQPQARRIA